MVPEGGQKSTAFSMSLSRSCAIKSGAPRMKQASGGVSSAMRAAGEGVAVAGDGGVQQRVQIEIHALGLLDALLDACRGAERAQDRLQAQKPPRGRAST